MGVAQHSLHRINSCTETSSTSLIMPKGSGLTKPMKLSADLADIVGKKEASRAECIKQLWAYIKKNNLQDPENKQFFTPDKKMAKVFGADRIRAFGMAKFLSSHLSGQTVTILVGSPTFKTCSFSSDSSNAYTTHQRGYDFYLRKYIKSLFIVQLQWLLNWNLSNACHQNMAIKICIKMTSVILQIR